MFKKLGKKAKAIMGVAGATIITSTAQAEVTYDPVTKMLNGPIDTTAYESAIPIVLGVVGLSIAVTLMFKMFGKAKSA